MLMTVLAIASSYMVVDIDLFHEMALFRQYLTDGRMPMTDDFAYTPTLEKVVHHEWGTGAVLYGVSVGTGWGAGGIVALKHLLCFGICVGCYVLARRNGVSQSIIVALGFVALNLGGWMAFTNIRAQLFTLAFLVALFFLINLDRRGKQWWIWVWVAMVIAWGNMHAGVVSGIGILAVYGISRWVDVWVATRSFRQSVVEVKHLLLAGFLTAVAININPYGLDYVPYLIRAIRMERPLILEWSPIWKVASFSSQMLFLFSIVVAVWGMYRAKTWPTFEAFVLLLTAYLAMKHLRHGSLYAVTWICLVPPLIERSELGAAIGELWQRHGKRIAVASLASGLVAIGCAMQTRFWELRIPSEISAETQGTPIFPVGAVDFLREREFSGNLFVPFQTGAFVSWNLYPQVKVSLDSRYEVAYPDGAVEENWKFYRADEGWRATLAKYDTHAVLVPRHEPVFDAITRSIESEADFGWKQIYDDGNCAVFERKEVVVAAR